MRPSRVFATVVAALALVMLTAGCDVGLIGDINGTRESAGLPDLPSSLVMNIVAAHHSEAMCNARKVLHSPAGAYHQETAVAVHELVGSARLDKKLPAAVRTIAATLAIQSHWSKDRAIVGAKWTDMGSGDVKCADGKLYKTAVLRQGPQMPATGRYSTPQYDASQVQQYLGIQYTSAVDYTGTTIPLLLDMYTPPAGAPSPRPTIIEIHGGAFVGGSRSDMAGVSKAWAVRGYNVMSFDYRLDQSLYHDSSPPKELAAATNAIIDGEQAVRWLKANAATYGVDTSRIAAVGYSAGGAVSLGMSAGPDFQQTGPNASYSSKIAAAVSTGAYLTPALDLGALHLTTGLAPILMFHYQTDKASNTGLYAYRTCIAYQDAGDTCDYQGQPGEGHTTDLTPGSVWWAKPLGPFIWQNLRLASLPG